MRMYWFVHFSLLRFLSMVAHSAGLPGVSICSQFSLYLGKRSTVFFFTFLGWIRHCLSCIVENQNRRPKEIERSGVSTLAEDNRARVVPQIRSDLFGRLFVICWYA